MSTAAHLQAEITRDRAAISDAILGVRMRLGDASPASFGEAVAIWARGLARTMSDLVRPSTVLSFEQALDALDAAGEVLMRLSERTNDEAKLARYSAAQRALLKETAALVALDWSRRDERYRALTSSLKAAKATLAEAQKQAKSLADGMTLAADVLTAFSKLVSALA
jgi:hypothetical protein